MEHKLKLSVVIAFAITTILFGKSIPTYAATEIRTKKSLWERKKRKDQSCK